jgi:hypothetical protein
MSNSEWIKIDFQNFIDSYGKDIAVNLAPTFLYSKKDKEHEAYNSLIAFFFVVGALLIYIALSIILIDIYFNLILFLILIMMLSIIAGILIINYLLTNVSIKPIEIWIETYVGKSVDEFTYICLVFYPIFSGICHPNKAKNVIYKLYQKEVLGTKIDISQIEVYLQVNNNNPKDYSVIGYFFQCGKGQPFKDEKVNRDTWQFFPYEKSQNENYLAVANWDHQFEWRDDLELDYDKLHNYAPWVIQTWDEENIKPLTDLYKTKLRWDLRKIDSLPKLIPWKQNLNNVSYESFKAYKDLQIVNEVIEKFVESSKKVNKIKDIKNDLFKIKAYFRDLKT